MALEQAGVGLTTAPVSDAGAVQGLLVAPAVASRGDGERWSSVASVLTEAFAEIQRFVAARPGLQGHVIAVLDARAAMGNPADPDGSALAGGMLSLMRTLALELQRAGISANTLMCEQDGERLLGAPELTALVRVLASQAGTALTGQEIFVCNGRDVGRLRP
jgi:NAD(P)-dependent dehydrogenase (short-subunit alcohol dehydrogenase family)